MEESLEPEHLLDIGLRWCQCELNSALFRPVKQHSEKATRNVFHEAHVDGDVATMLSLDQHEETVSQKGQVGTIPDIHFSDMQEMQFILNFDQHSFEVSLRHA